MAWIRDTLVNLISGLGTVKDKSTANVYALNLLTRPQLDAMYRSDWLNRKIVDIVPYDMTREWRDWQTDEAAIEALETAERELRVRDKISTALQRARLYGGSAIYVGIAGTVDAGKPLDINTIRKGSIEYLHVFSPPAITAGDIERDPLSPFYGEPKYYNIGQNVRIHPSRIIRFVGAPIPDPELASEGWGDSILQVVNDAVQNAALTQQTIASLLPEMKLDIVRVPGLSDILSTDEGTKRLTSRFVYANSMKSTMNTLLLEGSGEKDGETWEQKQLSLAGMPELLRSYLQIAAGAADIPATRLLGQSPTGLNSTGESDIRNYYDHISSKQNVELRPTLDRLDEILIRHALGDRPKDIWYEFAPLWQLSDGEKATVAKTKAETTKIYADTGLLPQEALSKGTQNQLIEDGTYPGFERALEEAPEIDFEEDDQDDTDPTSGQGGGPEVTTPFGDGYNSRQPRGKDGKWSSSGLGAVTTAAPNVAAAGKALGIDLAPGGSRIPAKVHSKLKDKRPQEYAFAMKNVNSALRSPDFVGRSGAQPNHLSFVKKTPNSGYAAVLVAIGDKRDKRGFYTVLTVHSIKESQVEARVRTGNLVPVKEKGPR